MKRRSNFWLAVGWGVLWGLSGGFWLLAPAMVESHSMTVARRIQEIALLIAISIILCGLGAFLGVVTLGVAKIILRITRKTFADPPWSIGTLVAVWITPAYVMFGAAIYLARFGRLDAAGWYHDAMLLILPVFAGSLLAFLILKLATSGKLKASRVRILAGIGLIALVTGVIALFIQIPKVTTPPTKATALRRIADGTREKRPLLIVGIDGGTWRTIEPLLAQGKLPTFQSVIDRGMYGDMKALWPPYWSTSAWGAIITGFPREDVGVYSDVIVNAPGLPTFQAPLDLGPRLVVVSAIEYALTRGHVVKASLPERGSLRKPPVWEMLDRSGIETGVVRFNFTYPAPNQAAVVISNRVIEDMWSLLGVKVPKREGLVAPESRHDELMAAFRTPLSNDTPVLRKMVPRLDWPKPKGETFNPVRIMSSSYAFDSRTFLAVNNLIRSDSGLNVVMYHLGGADTMEHAFWQFRFPQDFRNKPAQKDVDMLGPAIDRYMEFVDAGIASTIAAFRETPNVLIISDHGQTALEGGAPFKGWHANPGIFIAAGPDIQHKPVRQHVGYYDIVPTILDLKGLAKPADQRGHSLVAR